MGVSGGVLWVRAHSQVHRDYLARHCREPFNQAARLASGRLLSVGFLGPDDPDPVQSEPGAAAQPPLAVKARPPRRSRTSLAINPDYAFDQFVVGPGSRLAHAAAVAIASQPGEAYNPFFVHGNVGLGKTHLLQAICLRISQNDPAFRIFYTSCEGFMTEFMEAVQEGLLTDFRHRFRDVDVLVIDDIHCLAKRDRTQEEFFHTFNTLHQAGKQIILSSDAPPEEIPDLEDRLISRFQWGFVAEITPPCYETRVAILKKKAQLRGLQIPEEVACFVANRGHRNIRELEGALTKIQVLAGVEDREIDVDLARLALGQTPRPESEMNIQTIIDAVVDYFGVRLADLQSKRRPRSIAVPRQVCMHLAREYTRHSLEEIGGYFGGRDHTTVMHALKAVRIRRDQDEQFRESLEVLDQRIRVAARGI